MALLELNHMELLILILCFALAILIVFVNRLVKRVEYLENEIENMQGGK